MLPIKETTELQIREKDNPIIDVSYVELPAKVTCRIDLSGVLGMFSFLALLLIPGAVEGGNYILALVLVVILIICAQLSIREDGKKSRLHHQLKHGAYQSKQLCIHYTDAGRRSQWEMRR